VEQTIFTAGTIVILKDGTLKKNLKFKIKKSCSCGISSLNLRATMVQTDSRMRNKAVSIMV
jgi:hypothetical protein